MAEAKCTGTPLVVIGGAPPVPEIDTAALQDVDTLGIMASCSKWSRKIYDAKRIPDYISMAFRNSQDASPGPTYLEIPMDVVSALNVDEESVHWPQNYRTDAQPFGDPALIEQAAELLVSAKKPALVIGNGARYSSQYGEAVEELVNYLQIPVLTYTMARGLFADETVNPLFKLSGATSEADVVLFLSTKIDYLVGKGQPPFIRTDAKTIQVNTDKQEIGFNRGAEIGIVGGAGAVAKQILEAVKQKVAKQTDLAWVNRATELTKEFIAGWTAGLTSDALPINPGRCAAEVGKFLATEGQDWNVICDGGDATQWMLHAAEARRPGQVLSHGPLGTISAGPGFVTGAWAANGKPTLYYTGDGSLGFYAMELDTFERLGIPVVCVISNDSAWGMIRNAEKNVSTAEVSKGLGQCASELASIRRYDKMALMWEGHGELVTKIEDIVPAIKRGYASGKPSIINVETDQVTMSPEVSYFTTLMAEIMGTADFIYER
jgi:acetolactate synthase-1/2/3 large subunit